MIPHWQADDLDIRLYHGDCRHVLACLAIMAPESISCCVTSPPYYGLRDYGLEPVVWGGAAGCQHEWNTEVVKAETWGSGKGLSSGGTVQRNRRDNPEAWKTVTHERATCRHCGAWRGCLGLEPTPDLYVAHLTEVFAQVRRVLHQLGTLWINLGDSYNAYNGNRGDSRFAGSDKSRRRTKPSGSGLDDPDAKPKDLLGIPWLTAFALRAAGWHLRSDIIWAKPNPMPESVYDRPTKSHEYVFLFSKQQRYYYDNEAVAELCATRPHAAGWKKKPDTGAGPLKRTKKDGTSASQWDEPERVWGADTRNLRSVWQITTQPYPGAHFATFPEELARRCILAGCPSGGIVLDPFCGTGTTGVACVSLERRFIGIDASATYLDDHAAARIGAALVARGYT